MRILSILVAVVFVSACQPSFLPAGYSHHHNQYKAPPGRDIDLDTEKEEPAGAKEHMNSVPINIQPIEETVIFEKEALNETPEQAPLETSTETPVIEEPKTEPVDFNAILRKL